MTHPERSWTQPREQLLGLAERVAETPLTLVVAPAGSGKSTLLAGWGARLESAGIGVASLDLSPHHSDAGELAADLGRAFEPIFPALASELHQAATRMLDSEAHWQLGARAVQRALRAPVLPLVCLLDDYQNLEAASPSAQLLDELLRSASARIRFAVASRGAVPAVTARLRAEGLLLDVAAADLYLRSEEVERLLAAEGVEPTAELVAALLAQTEGWALGARLAAHQLASVPPAGRVAHVSGLSRERDLFAYFAGEVLGREEARIVELLECGALYGRASPREWVEVCDGRATESDVARAIASGLAQGDGREVWMHALWERWLRDQLRVRLRPDEVRALHARIAQACERNLHVERAFDLHREVEDWEGCTRLVWSFATPLLARGRRAKLLAKLEEIPRELRERDPRLLHVAGAARIGRDGAGARALLERAAAEWRRRGEREHERQAWMSVALSLGAEARIDEIRKLARRLLGARRLFVDAAARGELLTVLAARSLFDGRWTRSLRLSERAARRPISGLFRWLNAANRCVIHGLRGEPERAAAIAEEALADPALSTVIPSTTLQVSRAQSLAVLGRPGQARDTAEEAIETLRALGLERSLMTTLYAWATGLVALDEPTRARELLDECIALAMRLDSRGLECAARAERALVALREGDRAAARADAEAVVGHWPDVAASEGTPSPWNLQRAWWVIARTGDAARAWAATGGRVDPYGPAELPLVRHAVTLVASDLARLAGREADARRLACEAWEVARAAGLRVLHPILDTELLARSARAAVEDGRAGDAALDALRARDPRAAQALLRELAGHRAPAVRIRALQEIARWGDRAFHAETSAAQRDLDRRVRRAAADALARLDPHPRHGLRVETLGRFRALRGGEEIPEAEWRGVTTRRLLLRLLAGGGRPVGRERLLEDLWPETEPETARTHLRVALSRLNEVLEPERPPGAPAHFLVSDGDTLAWNRASELRWDAAEWEAAVASLPVPSPSDAASLLAARERFEAYGGPLVPELGADAWLDAIRLRLHERQAALGHRLAGALLARGDLEGCDAVAGRLAELDPADESAQALRARVRLRRGDRVAALRLLEQAAAELRRALDVEPGPELTELMATARKGTPAGPKRGSQSS